MEKEINHGKREGKVSDCKLNILIFQTLTFLLIIKCYHHYSEFKQILAYDLKKIRSYR